MVKVLTNSAKETVALGKKFSKILKEKDVVLFEGALGGGKTTFIKGILQVFNIKIKVLSPSFTLVRRYHKNNLCIYHIDIYRLGSKDIFDFGIEDFLYAPNSIALIEWAEKIEGYLPRYLKVNFSFLGETIRKISFSCKGYDNKIFSSIRKA